MCDFLISIFKQPWFLLMGHFDATPIWDKMSIWVDAWSNSMQLSEGLVRSLRITASTPAGTPYLLR
jgi:hypothetical protein